MSIIIEPKPCAAMDCNGDVCGTETYYAYKYLGNPETCEGYGYDPNNEEPKRVPSWVLVPLCDLHQSD